MKAIHKKTSISKMVLRAKGFLRSREDVLFSYLFGSTASGKTHLMSDLDIAEYLEGEPSAEVKLDLLGGLIDAVKTDWISPATSLPMKISVFRKVTPIG